MFLLVFRNLKIKIRKPKKYVTIEIKKLALSGPVRCSVHSPSSKD